MTAWHWYLAITFCLTVILIAFGKYVEATAHSADEAVASCIPYMAAFGMAVLFVVGLIIKVIVS